MCVCVCVRARACVQGGNAMPACALEPRGPPHRQRRRRVPLACSSTRTARHLCGAHMWAPRRLALSAARRTEAAQAPHCSGAVSAHSCHITHRPWQAARSAAPPAQQLPPDHPLVCFPSHRRERSLWCMRNICVWAMAPPVRCRADMPHGGDASRHASAHVCVRPRRLACRRHGASRTPIGHVQ